MKKSPRAQLHALIGKRERAEKRLNNGNPNAEKDFLEAEEEVRELLRKHPELESAVETVENHFHEKLYS